MKNKRIIIVLLLCIILLSIISMIIARYRSKAEASSNELEIAYYVFETDTITKILNLDAMVPRENTYDYGITVSNEQDGKISETAIEYAIQIRATTNLPLEYYLSDENGNVVPFESKNEEIFKDENGVYYIELTSPVKELGLNKEEHKYTLSILFPAEYKANSEYADVIELVEVIVDSKQKI